MQKEKSTRDRFGRFVDTLLPLVAVLLAFAVGGVILLLQGVNPLEAYSAMITGAFGSKNGLADNSNALPRCNTAFALAESISS